MTVHIKADWPLEKLLQESASGNTSAFPDAGINYFNRYVEIKQKVADKYYQATGTGLGAGGHRFTKHDIGHVDDVIRTAGHFIGVGQAEQSRFNRLEPFEIFVLLYAILLHDAGNAYGREKHEARPFGIMKDLGALCPLDSAQKLLVASIAQAHGGKAADNTKDTIPAAVKLEVSAIENLNVHGRRLAAVLRMADELSENTRRADEIALEDPKHPSYLPNFYCKTIGTNIHAQSGTITLTYTLFKEHLMQKHGDPENNNKQTYIIDYIKKRILKCDQERRYCNRFLHAFAYMPFLRANIDIFDDHTMIEQIPVDLSDAGYPDVDRTISEKISRLNGNNLKRRFSSIAA
ncbi:HD domain-containing protein [Hyphomicrobiales bacterium]|uniref:HD domain-containing protein n=1 Tax=Rhizobium nepotum TaxID=1035271 RepID=UPI000DD8D5EF